VPVVGDAVAPFMARPTPTRSHCAPSTHWPYSPLTRRRQPRKSSGDGRRSGSTTSSSAPALPTRSPRSLLRWPDTEPDIGMAATEDVLAACGC
jgi:hypothetical protein